MKKPKIIKQFEPVVTMEQMMLYEKGKPETYTGDKLVDAVLEMLQNKEVLGGGQVAERMGLSRQYLSCALMVLTGHNTSDIRAEMIARRWREYRKAHPKCRQNELAQALGFYDNSSLWRFIERNKKRFPEMFIEEDGTKNRMKVLVRELMAKEDIHVQRIYMGLPFKGGAAEEEACLRLLYSHARQVADLALEINRRHPEYGLEEIDVEFASLLHNIGIVWTNTPALHCHGKEPYIRHGYMGGIWLSRQRLLRYTFEAQNHIGSGIPIEEIISKKLPLLKAIPSHPLESLICYATSFYSIFAPDHRRTVEEIRQNLSQYGEPAVHRFDELHRMFG